MEVGRLPADPNILRKLVKPMTLARMIIVVALCFTVSASAQELVVLDSDENGMTIEYRPLVQRTEYGSLGTRFEFAEMSANDISMAGTPDLRFRKEVLALPSADGHRVEVLQIDYREDAVDRIISIGAEDGITKPGESGTAMLEDSDGWYPADIATLGNIGRSRQHLLGDLVITPVLWNEDERRVRICSRLVIRIEYGTPRNDLTMTTDIPAGLLNETLAAHWAVPRAQAFSKVTRTDNLASGQWYRFDVGETGVYRLSRSWFADAGFDVASLDPRTIRLFNSGGRELPTSLAADRPDPLQEIAIEIVGGDDGRFDDGDYVQFYGQGLSGFSWDASARRYQHYLHRFDDVNTYLLTVGGAEGKRMSGQASLNETGAFQPQWFTGREFAEEELVNVQNSGKLWVGKRLVPGAGSASSLVLTRKLNGLVRTQPVTIRVKVLSSSEVSNSFSVRDNTDPLGMITMGTVDFGSDTGDMAKLSSGEYKGSGQLTDDRSTVTVTYSASPAERSRGGYVDWVEWQYARRFEPLNDELLFSAPDTTAVIQFVLNGFTTSDILVYDISDFANVPRMRGVTSTGGTVRFQVANTEGNPRQFLAVAAPALKTAGAVTAIANSTLLASEGAEHLIITNGTLREAAGRLRAHRERAGEDFISSRVITVGEIYNEFNCGVTDPTAIRDFLAWAMENWTIQPRYVLFFGDGHFDYRNYTTEEEIIVPVCETENSTHRIESYVTDDYYGLIVGTDSRVDVAIGRIPVLSVDEANNVVDKIIQYETGSELEPWKNRVTFVADDGYTSYSDTDGNQHTDQSEKLAANLPVELEQDKIYIVSYRTENTAQGRRKPEAAEAIIDRINAGTLIINYTGHGAHDIWAHERIFISDVTIPQLTNDDRLTFVSAATCTFGLYDSPGLRSGNEQLMLEERGGSIGGLSAPRVVFSTENAAFNSIFFRHLLSEGRETDGRAKRIGDAIYSAKQRYNGYAGYEKFHLFADPGLRLALPRYRATVERIRLNGVAVENDTIQLPALSTVSVEGSVRRADNSVWDDYTGEVELSLYDGERTVVVQEANWNNYTYSMPGGLLYRGKATINAGRFVVEFIVPKDISYEDAMGRISMYFDNGEVDGAGYSLDIMIGGSDSTATPDTDGPLAELYMDDRGHQPGDQTGTDPLLIADLFDESGINTTGLGIGHDIEAWLDDSDKSIILNGYYRGDLDSYQRGTVEYRLRNLEPGNHTLRLRAWDIFNNSTTVETHFVVAGGLSIQELRNFPNPIQYGTTFTFRHNVLDPVLVDVYIYATNGRLERRLQAGEQSSHVVEVPWDGNNSAGTQLATGMYLYRVVCRTVDNALGSEATGRFMVVR